MFLKWDMNETGSVLRLLELVEPESLGSFKSSDNCMGENVSWKKADMFPAETIIY